MPASVSMVMPPVKPGRDITAAPMTASARSGDSKPLALISALLSSFSRPLESYNFRRLVSCATSFSSAVNTIFRCSTNSPTTLHHSAPRFAYKFGLLAAAPLLTLLSHPVHQLMPVSLVPSNLIPTQPKLAKKANKLAHTVHRVLVPPCIHYP